MMINWVMAMMLVAAPPPQADVQFERAVQKETADGAFQVAIEMYRKLAGGSNRAVAAKALIRMGQCYEKLGDADARKAYERVVREFADQKDAVAEARRRLGDKPEVVARLIERPAGVEGRVHEVSRDGRFLVCASPQGGRRAIYLRDVETGATRPILGESPRMRHPLRLSPDGSQLAFISRDPTPGAPPGELHVVRTDGSGLRAFTEKDLGGIPWVPSLWGWSPDGQSVLLTVGSEDRQGKVILVRVSDGSVRVLGSAAGMSGSLGQASMSPDGRFIAFVKVGGPGYMGNGISIRAVDGWRETPLSPEGNYPLWSPDGKKVLFVSNRRGPTDLWAIPVADGQPAGPPEMVRESIMYPANFTRDGELFYTAILEGRNLYTAEFDPRTGRPISKARKITDRYMNVGAAWSPDGRLLAYASLRDGREPGMGDPAALVIRAVATGAERVVAPKVVFDMNLSNSQWFPDNRSLLIQPQWGQQGGKLLKVDSETGDVQFLPTPPSLRQSGNWYGEGAALSPDGKALYYAFVDRTAQQVRIFRREFPDGEEKELKSLKAGVTHLSVSPDGSRLAFWMYPDEKDRNIRILTTMPAEGGELSQVKTGDVFPWFMTAWSRDGKRIFFVGLAQRGATPKTTSECDIWSVPAEGGEPVPLGIDLHTTIWFFHLHPDGKRLVFYDESRKSELWLLKNLPGIGKAPR